MTLSLEISHVFLNLELDLKITPNIDYSMFKLEGKILSKDYIIKQMIILESNWKYIIKFGYTFNIVGISIDLTFYMSFIYNKNQLISNYL